MKVPPKRKGNCLSTRGSKPARTLNESPSEKEGKSRLAWLNALRGNPQ